MRLYRRFKKSLVLAKAIMGNHRYPIGLVRCIYDNLGDIALAEAMDRIFPEAMLIDYTYNSKIKYLEKILRKDVFSYGCLGSGTLIFSPLNTNWFMNMKELMQKNIRFLFSFGTGVRSPDFFNDVTGEDIKEWVSCLKEFNLLSVRGKMSYELLSKYGIKDAHIIGEPALFFSRASISPKVKRKKIGINISNDNKFYDASDKLIEERFIQILNVLVREGWGITLFPCSINDERLTLRVVAGLNNKNIKVFRRYLELKPYMQELERQDIFLGVRLHSVVLAFCTYTPSLMIAYQPKCYEFMETMDFPHYIVQSNELKTDFIIQKINELYENIELLQNKQYSECQIFKKRIISFKNKIIDTLQFKYNN